MRPHTPGLASNSPNAEPDPPADRELLLVAACDGERCAALHRLRGQSDDAGRADLRAAVRERRGAVLLRSPCLGACHRGSLAAVGRAVRRGRELRWLDSPVVVERIEAARRSAGLADWIRTTAPRVDTLPAFLR